MLPSHPLNSDSTQRVASNASSYASNLHSYMVSMSHQLCSIRAEVSHLERSMVPVDLLDLMDHGGGVNPSMWMLEAARVVKVMEEGVKGRRLVWERVRERLAKEDGEEGGEEEEEGNAIPVSPLAYLADSVDLLALTYHNVLVMLRDYGSQMISEGAVQDGRRIREEMEGGGGTKKRKREQREKEKTPAEREKE
ncbi:hypothetical protein TrRE_jg2287, partial [Triparma retinervis]